MGYNGNMMGTLWDRKWEMVGYMLYARHPRNSWISWFAHHPCFAQIMWYCSRPNNKQSQHNQPTILVIKNKQTSSVKMGIPNLFSWGRFTLIIQHLCNHFPINIIFSYVSHSVPSQQYITILRINFNKLNNLTIMWLWTQIIYW